MADLYEALENINAIRGQVARSTEFRGHGAGTVAATGVLAGAAAALQASSLAHSVNPAARFLGLWIGTAVLAALVTSMQTIVRTRRVHPGIARHMMWGATQSFLPAVIAGVLMTAVLLRFAPRELWMLPGLWQILYGLGIFASSQYMPRQMPVAGIWFLATGLLCLTAGMGPYALSPWEMGFPFAVGQLLIAGILKFASNKTDF